MLTAKKSSDKNNKADNGGAKGAAAKVPPSVAKDRAATGKENVITGISNGIANLTLKEPPILPKMGQSAYKKKRFHGGKNGANSIDDDNDSKKNSGGDRVDENKKITRRDGWKNKSKHGGKYQHHQDRTEKHGIPTQPMNVSGRFDDTSSLGTASYQWLDRINQNPNGIQGVVFLNEHGQPVVEYLPQDGFEYKIVITTDNNNNQDGDKKQKTRPVEIAQPRQEQFPIIQPIMGDPVFQGYPLLEGTIVAASGPGGYVGNYPPQGYQPPVYGFPPQQQHGRPMMMMMMHPRPPSTPPRYAAPGQGMYAGYQAFQNELYFHPAQAGFGGGDFAGGGNYDQFDNVPPLPRLDEAEVAMGNARNENRRRVSLEHRAVEAEQRYADPSVPCVSPMPHE